MDEFVNPVLQLLRDVTLFSEHGTMVKLRRYQVEVASVIVDSVIKKQGLTFVVMFPRQSGKNELQAQIEAYLLFIFSQKDGEIVKVSPTYKPQSYNAMKRLERILTKNMFTQSVWQKERDYIYKIGQASCKFLSGSPEANVVGATASLLLEVDEAQDVLPSKFDKEIAPMAASTNATRVFWGTAWTSNTLLHRELVAAQAAEQRDGQRRAFVLAAPDVAAEVPAYGQFVADQVARMGRQNPMVKTQFFSEIIDGEGGMFTPERIAIMQGSHPAQDAPGWVEAYGELQAPLGGMRPGDARPIYAMLLDLAGEDEGLQAATGEFSNPGRDATALTIVEVDLATLADLVLQAPTYRVAARHLWIGVRHSQLYGQVKALADLWRVRYLVLDATGVGAGMASFLSKAMPDKVLPFIFSGTTKSKLGWDFLAIVDSGRWKEHLPFPSGKVPGVRSIGDNNPNPVGQLCYQLQTTFLNELAFCQYTIQPGPEKRMRWGVPDGTRDPSTGELVHDDLVLSAALSAVLEDQEWSTSGPTIIVKAADPLAAMDHKNF